MSDFASNSFLKYNLLPDIIESCLKTPNFGFESESTLTFDEVEPEPEDIVYEDDYDDDLDKSGKRISLEDKMNAVKHWRNEGGKKRVLTSVQSRYRYVHNETQLYKWERQIESHGGRYDKLQEIWEHTLNEFKKAVDRLLPIHDHDIQRWARKKARELNFDFIASKKWIWKFKSANRICSRKITKFVTSRYKQESEQIAATAQLFVESALITFSDYSLNQILNTDQSGFNYEMYSGRTLAPKGQKEVLSTVKSLHATTHSFTIQPTISLDGQLLSPLFLCLQEVSGQFGVRTQVFRPENVAVYCSSSGKMSKELVKSWLLDSILPSMGNKALLLLDSWTGQSDRKIFEDLLTGDKQINILKIPPKTTSLIQPLDVYFFRQWKIMARKFFERVLLDDIDLDLKQRNNTIKLHSLIHNQLSSPRFQPMIRYAWFRSGYLTQDPGRFDNVNKVCFKFIDSVCFEDNSQCSEGVFIICSWCRRSFCFTHYFIEYHYCNLFLN